VFVVMAHPTFAGQRAEAPADAVVLVRLVGSIHAEVEELGQKRTIERERVEIGTGSGFVVSQDGYVLTNEHVIAGTEITAEEGTRTIRIVLKPSAVEVCFSPDAAAARGAAAPCSTASVIASDPELDLAVLFVGLSNARYLALGDSDIVTRGQPVQALGYPFGRLLDIGRTGPPDAVPEITTTAGTISALRAGAAAGGTAERRFLQLDANVNPGNSGGPLIDRDGFAVGVIHSRLREASGIGFAIPINQAKDFLESRGLDRLMPARRLRAGPLQPLEGKGMAVRLPAGFVDSSPLRTRVEAEPFPGEVALRVDRVFSPWTITQLGQQLVTTQSFEAVSTEWSDHAILRRPEGPPLLLGRAAAAATDTGAEVRMVYAVLDVGPEKLLARFTGPAEQVAFNEGALRESLASLEGERLIAGTMVPLERLEWSVATGADGQRGIPFPAGWIVEPGAPTVCAGLPLSNEQGVTVPPQTFTVALRVAVWTGAAVIPEEAASRCSSRRGSLGAASYMSGADWLGVAYSIEGVFVRLGPARVQQMEVVSTQASAAAARALLTAWVKQATLATR
jgi:hypothetical protein